MILTSSFIIIDTRCYRNSSTISNKPRKIKVPIFLLTNTHNNIILKKPKYFNKHLKTRFTICPRSFFS